jgi:hypothetical protein
LEVEGERGREGDRWESGDAREEEEEERSINI